MDPLELNLKVTPKSSRSKIEVCADGLIKVWVTAAPTDGQANEAVIELLAKSLGIAKSKVQIVRGHASREKRVQVLGMCYEEAVAKLAPSLF
jgi:uncharacterized protein (TIGR00251 family)